MVSVLWKACSEGDLDKVYELLKEPSTVDIEIKDHTGVTPLIEAVKNGHVEVVRVLLEKGADPINSSNQGRPDQYTSEPSILELLKNAQNKTSPSGIAPHEPIYTPDANDDSDKAYYGPSPPIAYTYYPTLNSAPPPASEGGAYYPPPPPPHGTGEPPTPSGLGNLPPPEVARFIPCRYFPACRYGSSCLFAHPQAPYYQGSVPPPAQYAPPYDQMSAQPPYAPNYYAVLPPFPPPNGTHHMAPLSPPNGPHPAHGRSPSEVVSSPQNHFVPNGIPPSPYGHLPSSPYSHPGQAPIPMPLPSLPPVQHQHQPSLPPGTQLHSNMYNSVTTPAPPFPVPDENQYAVPQPVNTSPTYQEVNGDVKTPNQQPDMYNAGPVHSTQRDGLNHNRRGNARRGSFGGRKPPCLFFPAGRCKNGDDCRFPHVTPEGPGSHHVPYFSGRGAPRSRYSNANGIATINEKMASVAIDDTSRHQNGTEGSSRSQSSDPSRPRFSHNGKGNHAVNGSRTDKKVAAVKQRVPNADEFPVLAGSTTPPSRSPGLNGALPNGNSNGAPTAAQVLQAPPPSRKDSAQGSSTRGTTPDLIKSTTKDFKAETNGTVSDTRDHAANLKLPISFAAVANGTSELSKEIALSA